MGKARSVAPHFVGSQNLGKIQNTRGSLQNQIQRSIERMTHSIRNRPALFSLCHDPNGAHLLILLSFPKAVVGAHGHASRVVSLVPDAECNCWIGEDEGSRSKKK